MAKLAKKWFASERIEVKYWPVQALFEFYRKFMGANVKRVVATANTSSRTQYWLVVKSSRRAKIPMRRCPRNVDVWKY